jgi:cytidylate kinase
MRPRGLVIAIDGIVGAGKTTTARLVAEQLGYRHLDTGAMYRAVTLAATRRGVDPEDLVALEALLAAIEIDLEPRDQGGRILLDGEDVSQEIRRPEVTRQVGPYADVPMVRRALVAQQQRLGKEGGIVAEGRDIGAVVFPDAELKIAMVADLDERVVRRHRELTAKGMSITSVEVRADIEDRDRKDAERDYGVESASTGVIEIDTTGMTLASQVDHIVALARQCGA